MNTPKVNPYTGLPEKQKAGVNGVLKSSTNTGNTNTKTRKMPTYKEAWEKGGKALSDKYGGDYSKFESAAKKYNATKNEGGKPGTYKTNMKDFALNSQARRDEYDRRGWQHDSTTEVKAKAPTDTAAQDPQKILDSMTKPNNAVGKGGNRNPSIEGIASNTLGTNAQKIKAGMESVRKPIDLGGKGLKGAIAARFGENSATSTANMSLMKSKVDAPKGVVDQKGTPPEVDKKGREKIGGISYGDKDKRTFFGKGSMKTKGENTKRERDVLYNEEGKKMGTVKRNAETGTYDVKRTRRGKAAESARRVSLGAGTAEDAKFVLKNKESKAPSARKTRKENKSKSGDNYQTGSISKGLASGYSRGGNSSF